MQPFQNTTSFQILWSIHRQSLVGPVVLLLLHFLHEYLLLQRPNIPGKTILQRTIDIIFTTRDEVAS